jgi:hypothetical protein
MPLPPAGQTDGGTGNGWGSDGKSPVHAEETSRGLAGRSRKGSRVIPQTKRGENTCLLILNIWSLGDRSTLESANGHRFETSFGRRQLDSSTERRQWRRLLFAGQISVCGVMMHGCCLLGCCIAGWQPASVGAGAESIPVANRSHVVTQHNPHLVPFPVRLRRSGAGRGKTHACFTHSEARKKKPESRTVAICFCRSTAASFPESRTVAVARWQQP